MLSQPHRPYCVGRLSGLPQIEIHSFKSKPKENNTFLKSPSLTAEKKSHIRKSKINISTAKLSNQWLKISIHSILNFSQMYQRIANFACEQKSYAVVRNNFEISTLMKSPVNSNKTYEFSIIYGFWVEGGSFVTSYDCLRTQFLY